MEQEDTKWVIVLSKSKEALYYRNKITGQQKWTTKNCFCSNTKGMSEPPKPCCIKDNCTKQKETTRNQDIFNSNMAASGPLKLLSEKAYCLSDIIKELQILPPPNKKTKRSNKVKHLISKRKQNNMDELEEGIKVSSFENITLVNNDVSLATQSISMTSSTLSMETNTASSVTQNVPFATNSVSIPRQSVFMETDANFEVVQNDSMATTTVSMETDIVPVVMIGAETQCVSISTDDDGLEIVDEISNSITKINKSNTINDYVISMDKIQFSDSKDNSADQFNESENKTAHLHYQSQGSKDKKHELNNDGGLNKEPRNGNDELNANGQSLQTFSTEAEKQCSKKSKKQMEDKPKQGREMSSKRQTPQQFIRKRVSPSESLTATESCNVTAAGSVDEQIQVEESTNSLESVDATLVAKPKAKRPCSVELDIDVQGSQETQFISEKLFTTTANSSRPLKSEDIDVVGDSASLNILYSKGQDSTTINSPSGKSDLNIVSEKPAIQTETNVKRGRGRPRKNRRAIEDVITVIQPNPSHITTIEKAETSPSAALNGLNFTTIPSTSSEVLTDATTHQNRSSANMQVICTATSVELDNESSSLSTSRNCRVEPIVQDKQSCSTPSNSLLPTDLPTMVSLPTFPSEPTSPSSSNGQPYKAFKDTLSPERAPSIKFVSDANLHVTSGTMFFYPQNFKQSTPARQTSIKKLETIADSLKDISCKTVTGDSSVQTAAWLINVLAELDLKKNSCQQAKKGGQLNGGIEDICHSKPCSNHVSPPIRQSSSLSGSCKVKAGPTTSGANERLHQSANVIVQSKHPVDVPPPFQTVAKPRMKDNVSEVHASYVDVSWRIVTSSNGLNWTSLKSFYKLVPVRVKDEDVCSFLGVPVHSNNQVIAKLLNTSIPEDDSLIFAFEHRPNIKRNTSLGRHHAAVVLSFEWDQDTVVIMSKSQPRRDNSKGRSNLDKYSEGSVGLQLPKPVKLPEEGCRVYLGDFQVIDNDVNFVVSHNVIVSKTPRPYLSIPADALAQFSSNSAPATRCRVIGQARNDVKTAISVSVEKPIKAQKCQFCRTELTTPYDVKYHRRMHSATLGVKCTECSKRFLTVGRLSVHIDTHRCHVVNKCANCNKRFDPLKVLSEKDFLKYHHRLCYNCRFKTKCKKCYLYFPSREELNRHTLEQHSRTVALQTRSKQTNT